MQIYRGAVPFVLIQMFMVGVLIAFPGLVTGSLDKAQKVDLDKIGEQMREGLQPEGAGGGYGSDQGYGAEPAPAVPGGGTAEPAPTPGPAPESTAPAPAEDDPMKAMEEALKPKTR
jgi:hypothetical protein